MCESQSDVCGKCGPRLFRQMPGTSVAYDRGMTDVPKLSSEGQRALDLFKEQLAAVATMRTFRGVTPEFNRWKDSTAGLFIKYLPDSAFYNRFCIIQFGSAQAAQDRYLRGCDLAEQCIRAAIQDIERFDVKAAGEI